MSFLEDILVSTRARVDEARSLVSEEILEQRIVSAEAPKGFRSTLQGGPPALIAEIKRATPSKGELDIALDARKLADAYREGGAAAISVLTEPVYFKGSLEDMAAAKDCGLPVLRKDFIIDPWQVFESRAWGADAILLIVRCVGDRLEELHRMATSLGMEVLVEVFDEDDAHAALDVGAGLIGINHRDLATFEVDAQRTAKLAPMLSERATVVSLSGVSTREEVHDLMRHGISAVLVGESLVTSPDPRAKVKELLS